MRIFQAEDKEARTSESVGVSSTDALNYSWMLYLPCGVLLANVCACIGRGPFPKCISKHEEGPSRDQTVLRFMSFPALGSDHRTASCESNPAHPLTIFPLPHLFFFFFFCGFLSSTFTGSIISGHRATAVSTSEGIYYAADTPLIKWSLWGVKALTYHSIISCHKHLSTLHSPRISWLKPTTLKIPAV